jgi:hypothetical protein
LVSLPGTTSRPTPPGTAPVYGVIRGLKLALLLRSCWEEQDPEAGEGNA